jgi:hypothetical protein
MKLISAIVSVSLLFPHSCGSEHVQGQAQPVISAAVSAAISTGPLLPHVWREPSPFVTMEFPPETTTTAPPTTSAPRPVQRVESHDVGAIMSSIRRCESTDNYGAIDPSGSFRGAYQFNRGTWNGVASRHYPHLVGIDPAEASVEDQDAMALALYSERGVQPWPTCGRKAVQQ